MAVGEAGCSNIAASTSNDGIETLCNGSIYLLHQPKGRKPEVEIIFIHGLQLGGNSKEAHVTTWLARDVMGDNCWPSTWLVEKFPNARILSINIARSVLEGGMDLYLLGETLVREMVLDVVMIGQQGCPVVFVCHCVGGLVAKQIMVSGDRMSHGNERMRRLVGNVKTFFFYATPHIGLNVVNLKKLIPYLPKGPLVDVLEVWNDNLARLDKDFKAVNQKVCNGKWKFFVVEEKYATYLGFQVVEEASARYGHNHVAVEANHFDVCKPKSDLDTSFLYLVDCIFEVVSEEGGSLLAMPEFAVGMEERLLMVRKMLEENAIVGLVGMGGIGKTALSKFVYNRELQHYARCCFLEDVKSQSNIRTCQKQLYRDLCGSEWDKRKKDEVNLKEIRDCMSGQKVLVVVDDVGLEENLNALQVIGVRDGRSGSRMILTSREGLNMPDSCAIMRMDEIDDEQGMELFSYYAFAGMDEEVRVRLHEQAKTIVKACGGLPLSLEVIGQYLRKLSKTRKSLEVRQAEWEGTLRKLKAAESLGGSTSNERLWKKLRISIDDLAEGERRLFFDFACILWRSPRESSIRRICDSPVELENLKMCSLIKVGVDAKDLVMHEQLRDLGMKIVNEESDGGWWYGVSRLWSWEKIMSLESDVGQKELQKLEGLWRDGNVDDGVGPFSSQKRSWEVLQGGDNVKDFPKLRLLNLRSNKSDVVEFYLWRCSMELRWLCLNETALSCKSMEMVGSLKGLRVLQMKGCGELEVLQSGIGNLCSLKELDLTNCGLLRSLPNTIGDLKLCLQKLDLGGCKSLKALPNSICELAVLEELDLRWCESLECLPEGIGNLNSRLQKLSLYRCKRLKAIPNSICELAVLEELDLGECESLECLPEGIGNLNSRLQKLSLYQCKRLKAIPNSICELAVLEELDLRWCESLECLPEGIGNLNSHLQNLDLRGCKRLKAIPNSICELAVLEELDLRWCESLECLPEGIGNLNSHLQKLDLYGCKRLTALPSSICELAVLEKLDLEECESLECLPEGIGNLNSHLQKLYLRGCKSLKALPNSICELSVLEDLSLTNCKSLECLPEGIGNLNSHLQHLSLCGCKNLKALPNSICELSVLEDLSLTKCKSLECLPEGIGNLNSHLQSLYLDGCKNLKALPNSICELAVLEELFLMNCKSLECLPEGIGNLSSHLQRLYLYRCKRLKALPNSICELAVLEELDLRECESLECLPEGIGNLKSRLQKLDLNGCKSLKALPNSICDLVVLKELDLEECESLECLPEGIGNLNSHLQKLDLNGCKSLKALPNSICDLAVLEELSLGWCESLECLPEGIGNLNSHLRKLNLDGCKRLKALPNSICELTVLEELGLGGCESLECLPEGIGNLNSHLQKLNLDGCKRLKALPNSICELAVLEELALIGFESLECLPEGIGNLNSHLRKFES